MVPQLQSIQEVESEGGGSSLRRDIAGSRNGKDNSELVCSSSVHVSILEELDAEVEHIKKMLPLTAHSEIINEEALPERQQQEDTVLKEANQPSQLLSYMATLPSLQQQIEKAFQLYAIQETQVGLPAAQDTTIEHEINEIFQNGPELDSDFEVGQIDLQKKRKRQSSPVPKTPPLTSVLELEAMHDEVLRLEKEMNDL